MITLRCDAYALDVSAIIEHYISHPLKLP